MLSRKWHLPPIRRGVFWNRKACAIKLGAHGLRAHRTIPRCSSRSWRSSEIAQPLASAQRDTEEYAYIQALFDALIQMPGPIPIDVILPFKDSWRTEILILLSRDPAADGAESALLDMREHSMPDRNGPPSTICFSLYPQSRSSKRRWRKFALHTLLWSPISGRAPAAAPSVVEDPAGRFPRVSRPSRCISCGPRCPSSRRRVFIEQPVPIHYRRIVVPTDGQTEWSACQYGDFTGCP